MGCMSGNSIRDVANRRTGPVAAATLIGLLLAVLALPLCSAAFACTMPCCEHSSEPTGDRSTVPAPACPADCSIGTFNPASVDVLVSRDAAGALLAAISQPPADLSTSSPLGWRLLRQARSSDCPLHVVNGVFLI